MLREKQNIYENRKLHHVRPEKIRTRDQRRAIASIQRYREESETLRLRLKLVRQTEPENIEKQARLQKKLAESEELLALAEQIYTEYQKDMDSLPQRRVHIRRKKQNPEKLYRSVLLLIQEAKAAGINGLTKEETARKLNCPEYQIEQIFMRLNRKGKLHQAVHIMPHDIDRNVSAYGGVSGWISDWYEFRSDTHI